MTIEFWWRQIFEILMIHQPSRESLDVPQKIWARSVQPFWRLLDINKQTNKQTDRQAKFIYRYKSLDSTYIILPSFYHTVILCLSIHYAINRDGRVPFHYVCSLFVNDPFCSCFFNGNKNYLTFSINFILFLIERLFSKFSRSVKSFFYPFPAGGGGVNLTPL